MNAHFVLFLREIEYPQFFVGQIISPERKAESAPNRIPEKLRASYDQECGRPDIAASGKSRQTSSEVLQQAINFGHTSIFVGHNASHVGVPDFLNYTLGRNGRAIVIRKEMDYTDDLIDLPRADIVVFITRREDIVPAVARLTSEQGAAFFMLGESIETAAGDPAREGQAVH
ncbi:MAG: phosphoenolpyruvate carboxykinase (ATP), partial [Anaerolineae bacterium]|nr:phosphoenolpyruvate carboxykinase (ATP) [Anaerolineae bacterium]